VVGNLRYYGYRCEIYCCSVDKDRLVDLIPVFERQGVWVQFLPCEYVISERAVRLGVLLAIRDFVYGENLAKKLSLQVCLRIFVKRQIRDVLKILNEGGQKVYLVVVSRSTISNIFENIKSCGVAEEIQCSACYPDIDSIVAIYGLSWDIIRSQASSRGEDIRDIIEKIVLEKISTGFLWK